MAQLQKMLEKISGQRTVPNIYINNLHIGGHDDTMKVIVLNYILAVTQSIQTL